MLPPEYGIFLFNVSDCLKTSSPFCPKQNETEIKKVKKPIAFTLQIIFYALGSNPTEYF
jgi:hypothetical protein